VQKGQMPYRQHEIEPDVGRQWRDPQPLDGQPALRKPEQEQRRDDHGQDDVLQHVQAEKVIVAPRSEEHTSELQSRGHLVCRLLLEKKKSTRRQHHLPHNAKPESGQLYPTQHPPSSPSSTTPYTSLRYDSPTPALPTRYIT